MLKFFKHKQNQLSKKDLKDLKEITYNIRQKILTMLYKAGSGHPAGSLGMTDVFATLYFYVLSYQQDNPFWTNRDYCLLSNGHICPVWYATLSEYGLISGQQLANLRRPGAVLQGHPKRNVKYGIENTSGSLGQGISQAVGLAIALKREHKNNHVFCFMSDGEQQEGQVWEAYMLAAKEKLNNLTIIIDRNHIQIEGKTQEVMPLEPLEKKLTNFNLETAVINGHDYNAIYQALTQTTQTTQAIIANTTSGRGVELMENKHQWHGQTIDDDTYNLSLKQLKKFYGKS